MLILDDSSVGDVSDNDATQNTDNLNDSNEETTPVKIDSDEIKHESKNVDEDKCISNKELCSSSSPGTQPHNGDTLAKIGELRNSHQTKSHH